MISGPSADDTERVKSETPAHLRSRNEALLVAANVLELTDCNWRSEVLEWPVAVMVDFWAPWCGPCRMLAPTIEKRAGEYEGKVKVGKMNTDENAETPGSLRISA